RRWEARGALSAARCGGETSSQRPPADCRWYAEHSNESAGRSGVGRQDRRGAIGRRSLLGQVLGVADVLHQLAAAAVDELPDGEMAQGARRRRAVPVRDAGRSPDDVAGTDLALVAAALLHPADARRDDQVLARRMVVPSG